VPTHDETAEFWRDWGRLNSEERAAFKAAVAKLVEDLRHGAFRKGLRVKRYQHGAGVWEMTWADDGRALFRYGPSLQPGDPHIVWLRVGGHEIFDE
jgi:hypothetical protein